jgi:hypothetical protein
MDSATHSHQLPIVLGAPHAKAVSPQKPATAPQNLAGVRGMVTRKSTRMRFRVASRWREKSIKQTIALLRCLSRLDLKADDASLKEWRAAASVINCGSGAFRKGRSSERLFFFLFSNQPLDLVLLLFNSSRTGRSNRRERRGSVRRVFPRLRCAIVGRWSPPPGPRRSSNTHAAPASDA